MATRLGPLRPLVDDGLRVELGTLRADLIDAALRGDNILLTGPPGAGKTTALTQLAADLQDRGRTAVIVRGQLARTFEDLVALIWDALPAPERASGLRSLVPGLPTAEEWAKMTAGGPTTEAVSLGRQIESLRRSSPVTILLDDLVDVELADTLFARARDLLWDLGHQWVVAARPAQQATLTKPPAGAFWTRHLEMPTPTSEEWEALLNRRGLAGTREIQPRRTLRDAIVQADGLSTTTSPPPADADAEAVELAGGQWRLLDALRALGRPVTADDQELLARLGWSRAYASSVLRDLSKAGLLETESEHRTTPGRPRKLYTVIPKSGTPA